MIGALLLGLSLTAACGRGDPAPAQAAEEPSPLPTVSAVVEEEPVVSGLGSASPTASRSAAPSASTKAPVTASTTAASNIASRLRSLPTGTNQVVIVHTAAYATSYATLEAYQRRDGRWAAAFPAMAARIGRNGFNDNKREGDGTTPTGVYAFDATMYGIAPNPGVRYQYHQVVENDWWNSNSASPGYNTFVHGADPGGGSEALWSFVPQYNHFAVIRYNMPATPGLGSAIFLHVNGGGATLGCVSLAATDLVKVLRWLDPAAKPRIVMAPTARLSAY